MKKILYILMVLAVIISTVYYGPKVKRWLDIDSCLDNGGTWNYLTGKCEGERIN